MCRGIIPQKQNTFGQFSAVSFHSFGLVEWSVTTSNIHISCCSILIVNIKYDYNLAIPKNEARALQEDFWTLRPWRTRVSALHQLLLYFWVVDMYRSFIHSYKFISISNRAEIVHDASTLALTKFAQIWYCRLNRICSCILIRYNISNENQRQQYEKYFVKS